MTPDRGPRQVARCEPPAEHRRAVPTAHLLRSADQRIVVGKWVSGRWHLDGRVMTAEFAALLGWAYCCPVPAGSALGRRPAKGSLAEKEAHARSHDTGLARSREAYRQNLRERRRGSSLPPLPSECGR